MKMRLCGGLLAGLALMAMGCSGQSESGGAEEVRVGVILGLTGQYSQYGKRMKTGYDLALDALAKSPSRYRISLVEEDSRFDPATAVRAYQQLRNVRGISLFAGITGSRNAQAVCSASANDDIVILDPLSSAPSLTNGCGSNYFRIMPSDALAGRYAVDWGLERGLGSFAIVHVLDDWGNSYSEQIQGFLKGKGHNVVTKDGVAPGERDYSAVISRLVRSRPQALFLLLYASDGAAFMQQLRARDRSIEVFGSDNLSTDEFLAAGPAVVEGTSLVLPATAGGSAIADLEKAYLAKFGTSPPEGVEFDVNVTKAYDALMLLARAISDVGPTPEALRRHFGQMDTYESVSGPVRFDANGDLREATYQRLRIVDGRRIQVER